MTSTANVQQAFTYHRNHTTADSESIPNTIIPILQEAAEYLQKYGNSAKVEETKEACKKLLQRKMQLEALASAVNTVSQQYAPAQDHIAETDFEQTIDAAVESRLSANFDAENDSLYKDLVAALEQAQRGNDEEGSGDEDMRIARGDDLAPNKTCPLTGKQLLELEEPVEDQQGFVYEKQQIEAYIRTKAGGSAVAPSAGAVHRISIAYLRPARKVLRAQRKAKAQPTQTQAADDDDVMDVD